MTVADRRIGLEQEFFLMMRPVFLPTTDECCQEVAEVEGRSPDYFAPEWVKNMIEINTPPHHRTECYPEQSGIGSAGWEMSLRLYPPQLPWVSTTTEADILQEFAPATGEISRDEGLARSPVLRQARGAGSSLISISNRIIDNWLHIIDTSHRLGGCIRLK